jgi:hypothetical protein
MRPHSGPTNAGSQTVVAPPNFSRQIPWTPRTCIHRWRVCTFPLISRRVGRELKTETKSVAQRDSRPQWHHKVFWRCLSPVRWCRSWAEKHCRQEAPRWTSSLSPTAKLRAPCFVVASLLNSNLSSQSGAPQAAPPLGAPPLNESLAVQLESSAAPW